MSAFRPLLVTRTQRIIARIYVLTLFVLAAGFQAFIWLLVGPALIKMFERIQQGDYVLCLILPFVIGVPAFCTTIWCYLLPKAAPLAGWPAMTGYVWLAIITLATIAGSVLRPDLLGEAGLWIVGLLIMTSTAFFFVNTAFHMCRSQRH